MNNSESGYNRLLVAVVEVYGAKNLLTEIEETSRKLSEYCHTVDVC